MIASRNRMTEVPLDQIEVTFYVRHSSNEGRIVQFMKLYKAGVPFPPLLVAKGSNELVDGRHRFEAMRRLGYTHADVVFKTYADRRAMRADALHENAGGPLPASDADINHVIRVMLEENAPTKWIVDDIHTATGFPKSLVRRYIGDVQSAINKAKVRRAASAVVEGDMTAAQAAEEFGVDPAAVRKELGGGKAKRAQTINVNETKKGLSSRYRGMSSTNVNLFKKILSQVEDGELSAKNAKRIFNHALQLAKRGVNVVEDYAARLEERSK